MAERKRPAGLRLPDEALSPVKPSRRPRTPLLALKMQVDSLEGEDRARLEQFLFNKTRLLDMGQLRDEDFEKLRDIYSGPGRTVSQVRHLRTGLVLCRKKIHIDPHEDTQRAILRELRVLHDCNSPEIVNFYGSYFNETEQEVNIFMEYMDGGCIDDVIRRVGRIPEHIICFVCHKILLALLYLTTQHNVMHRDVKPSNMLVNSRGEVKLCDFGVSRKVVETRANTFVGTMRYMSPERIQGQAYTVKSDIWSLGLALIEMATGLYPIPPPEGDPMVPVRDPNKDPPLPSALERKSGSKMAIFDMVANVVKLPSPTLPPGHFSAEFDDFIARCLDKSPDHRAGLQELLDHPWIRNCLTTMDDVAQFVKRTYPDGYAFSPAAVGAASGGAAGPPAAEGPAAPHSTNPFDGLGSILDTVKSAVL